MAYFSNSTDGSVLDELCLDCIHGYDAEKGENRRPDGMPCAAWLLQSTWNYEQCDRIAQVVDLDKPWPELTPVAQTKKVALDVLLPNNGSEVCAMFYPLPSAPSDADASPKSPARQK